MAGKKRRYRLSPQAEDDLDNIWGYTVRTWSVEQAEIYHADIIAAIEALAKGERQGRDVSDLRADYFKYPVGQHSCFIGSTETC